MRRTTTTAAAACTTRIEGERQITQDALGTGLRFCARERAVMIRVDAGNDGARDVHARHEPHLQRQAVMPDGDRRSLQVLVETVRQRRRRSAQRQNRSEEDPCVHLFARARP